MQLKYKTRNIIDTSKRGILPRIEKRERVLAFAYVCGLFEEIHDQRDEYILHYVCRCDEVRNAVKELVSKVDWFRPIEHHPNIINKSCFYSIMNAATRHHMRFMRNRIGKNRSTFFRKALQYMYSPLFIFALIADRGKYDALNDTLSIMLPSANEFDLKELQKWFSDLYSIDTTVQKEHILSLNKIAMKKARRSIADDDVVGKYISIIDSVMLNKCREEG